jgi:hypothetical protein
MQGVWEPTAVVGQDEVTNSGASTREVRCLD